MEEYPFDERGLPVYFLKVKQHLSENGPYRAFVIKYATKYLEIASSFIEGLLQVDPCKRMSIANALEHPWLRNHVPLHNFPEYEHSCSSEAESESAGFETRSKDKVIYKALGTPRKSHRRKKILLQDIVMPPIRTQRKNHRKQQILGAPAVLDRTIKAPAVGRPVTRSMAKLKSNAPGTPRKSHSRKKILVQDIVRPPIRTPRKNYHRYRTIEAPTYLGPVTRSRGNIISHCQYNTNST